MKKEFFVAIWTFIGTTVGAGIFGLPYFFNKAGFVTGLVVLVLSALMMTLVSLYLGEIILRTKEKRQLTGLAGKYLGSKGKLIMFIANALSLIGALAAYIIGAGSILNSLFPYNSLLYSIVFFLVLAPIIYFSINLMKYFEYAFTPIKIIVSMILSVLLIKFLDFSNFSSFNFTNLLIPYGICIFAFTGISALPEMNEELKDKRSLFKAIIIGMILTFFIYLLFTFSVVGAVSDVNGVATTSLNDLSFGISIFANVFALLALATAFVALGFAFKENLTLDYKVGNFISWIFVVGIPLLIVIFSKFDFVRLLELSGTIAIGIMLFMILIIHGKSVKHGDRKPEYKMINSFILKGILFLILIIGIVYEIVGLI